MAPRANHPGHGEVLTMATDAANEKLGWQIITGDALEVLQDMDGESVDLIVTSPPYAQGLEYEKGLDWWGLYELISGVAKAALPAVKPSGFCFVNFGETTKYPRTMAELYNRAFRGAGWIVHSMRIWHKQRSNLTPSMFSTSIASPEYEHIWTFRKPPNVSEERRSKLTYRGVWRLPADNSTGDADHPAMFPISLPRAAIVCWSDIGDMIVDPFAGSHSTGVAAIQTGRRYIGIDISEEYNEMGRKRLLNTQPSLL